MSGINFIKTIGLCIAGILASHHAIAASVSPHWTHEEQAGWGAILDEAVTEAPLMYPYAECSLGNHQSPVDLSGKIISPKNNGLAFNYPKDAVTFFNSGHAAQVNTTLAYKGGVSIGSDFYPLAQFHAHAPAEHVIGSQIYPAELHFVHIRHDGKIAVVGVFLQEGLKDNPAFEVFLNNMPTVAGEKNASSGILFSPAALLPARKTAFYTYAGSLTTPPCSEGVSWYVLANPITVSTAQLVKLETLYKDNSRQPQALNERIVSGKK